VVVVDTGMVVVVEVSAGWPPLQFNYYYYHHYYYYYYLPEYTSSFRPHHHRGLLSPLHRECHTGPTHHITTTTTTTTGSVPTTTTGPAGREGMKGGEVRMWDY